MKIENESAINVRWDDANETLLVWHFSGSWSGEEYFETLGQLWEQLDSKPYAIDLLIDMRESQEHPSNLTMLMRAAIRSEKCGLKNIVVISPSTFWERIFAIAQKFDAAARALDVRFVKSLEAAYLLLGRTDN